MEIPRVTAGAAGELVAAIGECGCAVVEGVLGANDVSEVRVELDPHLESAHVAEADAPDDFYPSRTRRVTALIAKSPAVGRLALAEPVRSACDGLLLPNCERYQLHVASALMVGPGARAQVLHREDDVYPFFELPRPDLVVASMWALDPFTDRNGGTLLVPGSHRWDGTRVAREDEVRAAEMDAGSVLIWLGGTLHGAGANRTERDWRCGLFLSYSLGWLRQEENQYLDVPVEVAERLPPELQALAGYAMHSGLGFWDRTR